MQRGSTRRGAHLARLLTTQWLDERDCSVPQYALVPAAPHLERADGREEAEGGVTDARADKPLPPGAPWPPDDDGESGRGLLLVDALANRWGHRVNDPITKTLWAELELPG
ncbi:ATP-binding protein [Streptomyces smyrnaeus]|uniref:ATP-binding protein n=1 Tax=Streptomyces smyrnaeus TaxID=1387713 RepID=UPI0027DCFB63|nr:ATP-binding protein [Streptomyces smyrnaeus]